MTADENTPLIPNNEEPQTYNGKPPKFSLSAPNRILLAGILISIALSFTQVPILYVLRLMECDEFYKHHSDPFQGSSDRCTRSEIDAATAKQVSILGMSTVCCGILNLFVAGWQVKKWGPKAALISQTFFPSVRVLIQVLGITIGAKEGVTILQCSQIMGLVGGASGYLLVLNTAAGEVVKPSERTAMFGKLQGSVMLGTAVGYLLGGLVGDAFGIRRPFEVASVLFSLSSLYAALFIPYIDPKTFSNGNDTKPTGLKTLYAPFKVLMPQKIRLSGSERVTRHAGITFLALGVFLGVLATGYAPILIQMYATAAFNFRPTENGYLMASNALIRGFFLIFAFPRIISLGRTWFTRHSIRPVCEPDQAIPTAPEDFDTIQGIIPEQEPALPLQPADEQAGKAFDLFFLRWSLLADGLITAYTASATKSWHIYLAGLMLPLASGSAPASKGVITEMCSASQRADSLQAMTLVENVAMLSTLGIFGSIFAMFSDIGKAYLTFYCNAAVALLAVTVLLFSRFPAPGATLEDNKDITTDGSI